MVKVKATLSNETTKLLNKYAFKRIWLVMLIVSLVFIALGVLGVVFPEDATDLGLGIFLIVFGVLYAPIVWFVLRFLQRKRDKTAAYISSNVEEIYAFDDEKVTITQTKGEMLNSTTQTNYDYFYKIVETPTHFYMYISKAQCHVIPKDGIIEGSVEELKDIFTRHLPTKFHPCK